MTAATIHRLVRATDPSTSVQAAEDSRLFSASHCERILAALEQHGPKTAHELAALTRLTVVQIDRRLPELAKTQRARVQRLGGLDVTRDGFRVWEVVTCQS